jgi:hypothetical protein
VGAMNNKQLREEIDRIRQRIYRELDFETRKAIHYRQMELMDKSGVNKTKGGIQRYYLPKSCPKAVVEDYYEQLVNTVSDILGTSL